MPKSPSFNVPHLLLFAYACWIEKLIRSHDLQSSREISHVVSHISLDRDSARSTKWPSRPSFTEDLCAIYIIAICYPSLLYSSMILVEFASFWSLEQENPESVQTTEPMANHMFGDTTSRLNIRDVLNCKSRIPDIPIEWMRVKVRPSERIYGLPVPLYIMGIY